MGVSISLTVEAPSRSLNRQVCMNFLISNNDDATKNTYSECQGQNSEENNVQANHILFLKTDNLARADRMSFLLNPSMGSLLITLQHKMLLNLNKI
jgi:hypothetical protein